MNSSSKIRKIIILIWQVRMIAMNRIRKHKHKNTFIRIDWIVWALTIGIVRDQLFLILWNLNKKWLRVYINQDMKMERKKIKKWSFLRFNLKLKYISTEESNKVFDRNRNHWILRNTPNWRNRKTISVRFKIRLKQDWWIWKKSILIQLNLIK